MIGNRVSIVLPNLDIIGAQRVALDLGKQLIEEGYTVSWVIGVNEGKQTFELQSENYFYYGAKVFANTPKLRLIESFLRLAWILLKSEADVILSVTPLLNRYLCALKILKVFKSHLVIEDHSYPPRAYEDEFKSISLRFFYRNTEFLYQYADILRTLTIDTMTYYKQKHKKINSLNFPNLLDLNRIDDLKSDNEGFFTKTDIVYIGRFESQKNIKFLIEIYNLLLHKRPNTSLTIIGYGSQEAELRNLVSELGLSDRIQFLENSNLNFKVLAEATVFPLVSRWEGFPLVLLEAMYLEVAVVSVDCKTGPAEIIGADQERGWLVPEDNAELFVEALIDALDNESVRLQKTQKAHIFVKEKVDINTNLHRYTEKFLKPSRVLHSHTIKK